MALTFGFYDSLNHDRVYNAQQMSEIFDGIITDGVFANIGDQFHTVPGGGMRVLVESGRAWFNSTWTKNDVDIPLNIDSSDSLLERIDTVVLEVNSDPTVRANSIKVVKGTPASSPVKPTLTNTATVHQHPLAYVTIRKGTAEIARRDIEIAVGKTECPFITSVLQSTDISDLFTKWGNEFETWFETVRSTLDGDVALNLQNQIDSNWRRTLTSATKTKLGLPDNSVPDDAFSDLADKIDTVHGVGDVVITSAPTKGDKWALCNGGSLPLKDYPDVYTAENDGKFVFRGLYAILKTGYDVLVFPVTGWTTYPNQPSSNSSAFYATYDTETHTSVSNVTLNHIFIADDGHYHGIYVHFTKKPDYDRCYTRCAYEYDLDDGVTPKVPVNYCILRRESYLNDNGSIRPDVYGSTSSVFKAYCNGFAIFSSTDTEGSSTNYYSTNVYCWDLTKQTHRCDVKTYSRNSIENSSITPVTSAMGVNIMEFICTAVDEDTIVAVVPTNAPVYNTDNPEYMYLLALMKISRGLNNPDTPTVVPITYVMPSGYNSNVDYEHDHLVIPTKYTTDNDGYSYDAKSDSLVLTVATDYSSRYSDFNVYATSDILSLFDSVVVTESNHSLASAPYSTMGKLTVNREAAKVTASLVSSWDSVSDAFHAANGNAYSILAYFRPVTIRNDMYVTSLNAWTNVTTKTTIRGAKYSTLFPIVYDTIVKDGVEYWVTDVGLIQFSGEITADNLVAARSEAIRSWKAFSGIGIEPNKFEFYGDSLTIINRNTGDTSKVTLPTIQLASANAFIRVKE